MEGKDRLTIFDEMKELIVTIDYCSSRQEELRDEIASLRTRIGNFEASKKDATKKLEQLADLVKDPDSQSILVGEYVVSFLPTTVITKVTKL